ncbi:MAG: hypothetical protein ACLFSQ_10870 [Candidatus Zixiibacteriota bacterium]
MKINNINPENVRPQKPNFQKFDKILSKREKAYIEKSFPNKKSGSKKQLKPKEHLGRYINIKV